VLGNVAIEETPFGPITVRREWLADEDSAVAVALTRCLGLEGAALEAAALPRYRNDRPVRR